LIFQISETCLPPLPLAAGENARKPGFWQTKAYKSKTNINFADFFLDIPKGETFVLKNQRCIFILGVLFCGEINALYFGRW
jgi:hypothetical protein